MKFHYISSGRLYACEDGKTAEIPSNVLDAYLTKVRESAGRNEWKYTGEGASFRGAYQPGMDAESRVSAVRSRIFCAAEYGDSLLYSLAIDRSSGIYRRTADSDTDGIVLSSGDSAYTDFDIAGGRIAVAASFAGETHIGVLEIGGNTCRIFTEGYSRDTSPCWSAREPEKIYFSTVGLALKSGDDADTAPPADYASAVTEMFTRRPQQISRGPAAVCLLDTVRGTIEDVLADDRYDFTHPQSTEDGALYYIRKPYDTGKSDNAGCLTDLLMMPIRLLRALFGFLNVFSAKYSGKTLSDAAGVKSRDEKQTYIDGNLVNAEKELRENRARGEENPGIIPHTWELRRLGRDGTDTLIRRGVSAFRVREDGGILISNGSAILHLTADGKETKAAAEADVTYIR